MPWLATWSKVAINEVQNKVAEILKIQSSMYIRAEKLFKSIITIIIVCCPIYFHNNVPWNIKHFDSYTVKDFQFKKKK